MLGWAITEKSCPRAPKRDPKGVSNYLGIIFFLCFASWGPQKAPGVPHELYNDTKWVQSGAKLSRNGGQNRSQIWINCPKPCFRKNNKAGGSLHQNTCHQHNKVSTLWCRRRSWLCQDCFQTASGLHSSEDSFLRHGGGHGAQRDWIIYNK